MIKKNFFNEKEVIFSPKRSQRIKYTKENTNKELKEDCPFCIENKHMITDPIYTSFNEEIRVIINKFPISKEEPYGIHYVLIDTKNHYKEIIDYDENHLFYLMKSIKDIFNILYLDTKLKYVQVFKNKGKNAGASQEHSHWQILGLDILSKRQQDIKNAFEKYRKENNSCYLCDINYEKLLICQNDTFVAFCPEDSLFSYEINIAPKQHIANISLLDDKMLMDMGNILKICLIKLDKLFNDLDYNICIYTAFKEEREYHLFIQIIPRIGNFGGFEISTDMYVNSSLVEDAIKNLRKI